MREKQVGNMETMSSSSSFHLFTAVILVLPSLCWGQMYPHSGSDNFPVFKILIAVPIEKATIFSRDLQEAIGWWEGIHRSIGRPNWNNVYAPTGDELNPGSLQFSQIHVGNDTMRLFHSICDAVEKDTPSIILSLIDAKKTDYMRMIAESADIPLVTLSHDYMKEPQNVIRRISPNRQVRGCNGGDRYLCLFLFPYSFTFTD